MKKKTQELLTILESKDDIYEYFTENCEEIMFDSLQDILEIFLKKKGKTKSEVLDAAQLEKHYGYQIFSGMKNPSRDKLIMICFGLELNLDEIQQILKKSAYGTLYPRDRRDSVIIFAIHHKLSIIDTNELLYEMNLKLLE
jgi:DNA-binding phage protein